MKLQKQAEHIWRYALKQQQLMKQIGLGNELAITKDVALCIIANPGIFLEDIIRHEMFRESSRSTIKRAVAALYLSGYVKYNEDLKDKRRNLLYFRKMQ